MAHAQRKLRDHWATPQVPPRTPLTSVHKPANRPLRDVVEAAPQPQWDSYEKAERRTYRLATALFGGVLIAAVVGWIPLWISIVGIIGLVATGMGYVVTWLMNELPPTY